jgi:hypothetical protein
MHASAAAGAAPSESLHHRSTYRMKVAFLILAAAVVAAQTAGCSRAPRDVVEARCKLRIKLLASGPGAAALPPGDAQKWAAKADTVCRCQAEGAAAAISLEDLQFYVKETDFRQDAQRKMWDIERRCSDEAGLG